MNDLSLLPFDVEQIPQRVPVNLSRRGFVGATLGALVLGVAFPALPARAQQAAPEVKPGSRVAAFLEIRPDGSVMLQSPFIEGGQGIFTAMAQIVGEELDADPTRFTVECAPAGPDYLVMAGGRRITGGSQSVRTSYETMRRIGASARQMLLQAAAARWGVPISALSTEPGRVVHAATARSLDYGDLAAEAAALSVPENVSLKAEADFRWIGKPLARLDSHDKSTGKAIYTIDIEVAGMLHAAVQHAPLLGSEPGDILNEDQVKGMPGVHSVHKLPGAVAVVADQWWRARRAAESLQVKWRDAPANAPNAMPADFSSEAFRAKLVATPGPGNEAEKAGDSAAALQGAANRVEATYDAPYLVHGQLEPPAAVARFNEDGTLDLWLPNQGPETFQQAAAKVAGLQPGQVRIHSPLLGGFFGRHFLYAAGGNPFPQAILLAKAVGRPVKLIWSREEEFLRDTHRPMGVVRFRGGVDQNGMPIALEAEVIGEGAAYSLRGRKDQSIDPTSVEGIVKKPYAIANRRIGQVPVAHPATVGFWRSVGHSMNDFFYETFFDELADLGKQDPYGLRLRLLSNSPRHKTLLEAVGDLSGGWKRGPFDAPDGSKRARGVAMASPFGSEVATIAEVSLRNGAVVVHDVWVAFDPGRAINPAILEAQVNSAVALGLSTTLFEEVVYEEGRPKARNFDAYRILPPDMMPRVHVRIVESGEPMGGVGEPGLPGVPPAVVNAVAALTGRRVRSLPLSKVRFGERSAGLQDWNSRPLRAVEGGVPAPMGSAVAAVALDAARQSAGDSL